MREPLFLNALTHNETLQPISIELPAFYFTLSNCATSGLHRECSR